MKAWLADVDGFGTMIVSAPGRAQARYAVWSSAREAGYSTVGFGTIRVVRSQRHDAWASKQSQRLVVSERFAA